MHFLRLILLSFFSSHIFIRTYLKKRASRKLGNPKIIYHSSKTIKRTNLKFGMVVQVAPTISMCNKEGPSDFNFTIEIFSNKLRGRQKGVVLSMTYT